MAAPAESAPCRSANQPNTVGPAPEIEAPSAPCSSAACFTAVKQAALEHGALGASISGAGPTVFGWFADRQGADSAGAAMVDAFATAGLPARAFVSPVAAPGARVTERG